MTVSNTYQHVITIKNLMVGNRQTRERIASFQNLRLLRVVHHAYNRVKYYRRIFDKMGLAPEDIQCVSDLKHIPVTSCGDYRNFPVDHVISHGLDTRGLICNRTSGSSSSPFSIYRGHLEEHLMQLFRFRAYRLFGVNTPDRVAHLKLLGLRDEKSSFLRSIRRGLYIYRDYRIDCLQPRDKILRNLKQLNCDVIIGYPSTMTYISPYSTELEFSNIRPRLVITGGESITPFERGRIKDGFKTDVLDIYGANEFNILAWQCRETGYYHICDDNVIVEILKDGSPVSEGERGEVVATSLHAYTMPFIRYSLGDIATKGPDTCPCGQPYSTLKSVQGRVHDYFFLTNGPMCPNEIAIPIVLAAKEWIDRYKIIQETESLVKLYIKTLREPTLEEISLVEKMAVSKLGPEVEFEVKIVDKLPFDPSGKFRISRSKIYSHLEGTDWSKI